jgi:hypothetical protein
MEKNANISYGKWKAATGNEKSQNASPQGDERRKRKGGKSVREKICRKKRMGTGGGKEFRDILKISPEGRRLTWFVMEKR